MFKLMIFFYSLVPSQNKISSLMQLSVWNRYSEKKSCKTIIFQAPRYSFIKHRVECSVGPCGYLSVWLYMYSVAMWWRGEWRFMQIGEPDINRMADRCECCPLTTKKHTFGVETGAVEWESLLTRFVFHKWTRLK